MHDSVPYFVIVRYRNPKLTKRCRFASYRDADVFVFSTVCENLERHLVMPVEVKIEVCFDIPCK